MPMPMPMLRPGPGPGRHMSALAMPQPVAPASQGAAGAELRGFLEAVPVALLLLDPATLAAEAGNGEAAALLHCGPDGLGMAWQAALEAMPEGTGLARALLAAAGAEPFEARLWLARGAVRDVLVRPRLTVLEGRAWLAVTLQDITRRRRAEQAQAEAEGQARRRLAELETLYRTAPLGLGQLDDRLRYVRVNEALAGMNGIAAEDHLGRSAASVVPDLQARIEPLLRRVLATGERVSGVALSGQTAAAPGLTRDWVAQFYPVHDPETRQVAGVGIVVEETTGRQRAERAQTLLLRELDHRVKNLFAVIAGLVSFSARGAASPQEMRATLLGRIDALARAHDLVKLAIGGGVAEAPAPGQHTTLQALAEALLAPFRTPAEPGRLRLEGEPVTVGALAAPPLALVLHELATNAARHGALSCPGGTLAVQWQHPGADGTLRLRWDEQVLAMPAVANPGFGQRLVTQCAAQLGGQASFEWRDSGLLVELVLPLARLQG